MTRFGLNVERTKPKEQPEELSLADQLLGELKDRLPSDAGYKLFEPAIAAVALRTCLEIRQMRPEKQACPLCANSGHWPGRQ